MAAKQKTLNCCQNKRTHRCNAQITHLQLVATPGDRMLQWIFSLIQSSCAYEQLSWNQA